MMSRIPEVMFKQMSRTFQKSYLSLYPLPSVSSVATTAMEKSDMMVKKLASSARIGNIMTALIPLGKRVAQA